MALLERFVCWLRGPYRFHPPKNRFVLSDSNTQKPLAAVVTIGMAVLCPRGDRKCGKEGRKKPIWVDAVCDLNGAAGVWCESCNACRFRIAEVYLNGAPRVGAEIRRNNTSCGERVVKVQ